MHILTELLVSQFLYLKITLETEIWQHGSCSVVAQKRNFHDGI